MRRPSAPWLLTATFLIAAFLVAALGQRKNNSTPPPLDDWHFSQLIVHLNRAGLSLRGVSTQKGGVISDTVFLTTTEKSWDDLNRLSKDPGRIGEWHGILYCERIGRRDPSVLTSQWGEDCLVVGPFLFYGDRALLNRIRAVLNN